MLGIKKILSTWRKFSINSLRRIPVTVTQCIQFVYLLIDGIACKFVLNADGLQLYIYSSGKTGRKSQATKFIKRVKNVL